VGGRARPQDTMVLVMVAQIALPHLVGPHKIAPMCGGGTLLGELRRRVFSLTRRPFGQPLAGMGEVSTCSVAEISTCSVADIEPCCA